MAETKIFLQLEPVWSNWTGPDGERNVNGLKVTKTLQRRPTRITGVVVELTLRVPDGAFKPLRPSVTIDVPESALDYQPVVTVEMPEDES